MKEQERTRKESKSKRKVCVDRAKFRKNSHIVVFREPPYLLLLAAGLGVSGLGLCLFPVLTLVSGHLDGQMFAIIGGAWFLIALKLASLDERINLFFDAKRGVVRVERVSLFKSKRTTEFKRSDIAGARVTESYDENNTMYGAEFLLKDGTTVPMAICQTGGRGVWDKAVQVTNEIVLRRKPGKERRSAVA